MSNEAIPGGQERFERGPSAAAMGFSQEREFTMDAKGEEYRNVLAQIGKLEADLEKGNDAVKDEPQNSPKRNLANMLGRKIQEELNGLNRKRLALESENPGLKPN